MAEEVYELAENSVYWSQGTREDSASCCPAMYPPQCGMKLNEIASQGFCLYDCSELRSVA
jgi:hypothetical protein